MKLEKHILCKAVGANLSNSLKILLQCHKWASLLAEFIHLIQQLRPHFGGTMRKKTRFLESDVSQVTFLPGIINS